MKKMQAKKIMLIIATSLFLASLGMTSFAYSGRYLSQSSSPQSNIGERLDYNGNEKESNVQEAVEQDYVISWNDPNLERAIRKQLNRLTGDIRASDVRTVDILELNGSEITDISALSEFKGLKVLLISHNQVKDFTPLQNLNSLVFLTANDNGIDDFSSLQKLKNLKVLFCGGN